jgi:hypothetical protein
LISLGFSLRDDILAVEGDFHSTFRRIELKGRNSKEVARRLERLTWVRGGR